MKKILLIFAILVTALFFAGCVVPSIDIKDIQVEILGFEQNADCGTKTLRVLNGGDKCTPACDNCCPNCPFCESCCGQCEECPECEICEECPECGVCEECPECEICEECPECPACPTYPCCSLQWGDLFVDLQLENIGDAEVILDKICFTIYFSDDTKIDSDVLMGDTLLVGENIEKEAEIKLSDPVKRVTFVKIKSYEFY